MATSSVAGGAPVLGGSMRAFIPSSASATSISICGPTCVPETSGWACALGSRSGLGPRSGSGLNAGRLAKLTAQG
eukprot:9285210-Pyramimonas_sp.AAC.1